MYVELNGKVFTEDFYTESNEKMWRMIEESVANRDSSLAFTYLVRLRRGEIAINSIKKFVNSYQEATDETLKKWKEEDLFIRSFFENVD